MILCKDGLWWNPTEVPLFVFMLRMRDEILAWLDRAQCTRVSVGYMQNEKTQLVQQLVIVEKEVERFRQAELAALRVPPPRPAKPVSDQTAQVDGAEDRRSCTARSPTHPPSTPTSASGGPSRRSHDSERVSPSRLSSVVYMLPRPPPAARKTGARQSKQPAQLNSNN